MVKLEVNEKTADVIDMLKSGERTPEQFLIKKESLKNQGVDVDLIHNRLLAQGKIKAQNTLSSKPTREDVEKMMETMPIGPLRMPYGTSQRMGRGLIKGASLGYIDLPGKENPIAEFAGGFAPYMAASAITGGLSNIPKVAQIASKAPAIARMIQVGLPMAGVGFARPAKNIQERLKQAAFEGTVGAGLQGIGELATKVAPAIGTGVTKILSTTTGVPEDKIQLAISDTLNVFKYRGKQVWDKLAGNLKKGNELLQKRAGMEIQDAIANSPKLSKVAYGYDKTKNDILQKVAYKQAEWLGADRMTAGEKETLNKLYQMIESPEGRFGDQLTFSKLHQAKKLLDDTLTFAQSNRLNPAPTEGEKLLKGIRSYLNQELGRDVKAVPEVANYVKANKFYSLYKEKLEPIKALIEDRSMSLPQKLKGLENKSEDLQKAIRTFDKLLPKEYRIKKGLEMAQTAQSFAPLTRKGTGILSGAGLGATGVGAFYNPLLASAIGAAGLTTSPATVGFGLQTGAKLSNLLKGLPSESKATIPILMNMMKNKNE